MEREIFVATLLVDHFTSGFNLKKGEEVIVDVESTFEAQHVSNVRRISKDVMYVKRRGVMGIDVFEIDIKAVTIRKVIHKALFKPGDVVRSKKGSGDHCIPFRITSVSWHTIDFWYQSAWGDAQGLASGALQQDIRLATSEEMVQFAWAINSSDKTFML